MAPLSSILYSSILAAIDLNTKTMLYIDPHIHTVSRTTDDYEAMRNAGIVAVIEPAFWLGQPRTTRGSYKDYFSMIVGWERFRAGQFGIRHYCTIGLNSKEANNEPLAEEVMELLPLFAMKEGVVAIGEIGYDDMTAAEEGSFREQLSLAKELGVTGVMAMELFETTDGRILVNELAMRPHNTGHWSMDGAVTGQFENHLRAVLDLPLGSPEARAPWTVMVNILGGSAEIAGDLYAGYPHVLARDPRLKVHLYGKDVKPGRKVGHVTAYGDDLEEVRERALHAAAWFRGDLGDESD